jgi:Uncharacterized protein conserved in bacteria (DUF2264)
VAERLPPEDRSLSPFTGWTRSHWETVADTLLRGVRPHFAADGAFVHLPGGRPSSRGRANEGLEGYARTFLLAAYRGEPWFLEPYAEGLRSGPDRWPRPRGRSQAVVEAAILALALAESRELAWDRLSPAERGRLADWLGTVRVRGTRRTNWLLFPVLVHAFLRSVGAPYRQVEIERGLDALEPLHRGGGWYADGRHGGVDHYAGWGFAAGLLAWCRLDGGSDPARARLLLERVRAFLDTYRLLVGGDGSPLHHGRSLVYRFAPAAPFVLAHALGASPLTPGETRRLASGMVRRFVARGAIRDGRLTLGWTGEFTRLAQHYSGAASPYWAARVFAALRLPPDDPFWLAPEEPLEVERGDYVRALPQAGLVVAGTRADGVVRAAAHGPISPLRRHDPHYSRLAYTTHAAPELGRLACDSTLALGRSKGFRVVSGACSSRRLIGPALVDDVSIVLGRAELRLSLVRDPLRRIATAGGYALASDDPPVTRAGPGWASVRRTDGLTSVVVAVHGFTEAAADVREETNAFGRHSATPLLTGRASRVVRLYASLVVLSGEAIDPDEERARVAAVRVEGQLTEVELADGQIVAVRFGLRAPTVRRSTRTAGPRDTC